jgi:hypothetical protein
MVVCLCVYMWRACKVDGARGSALGGCARLKLDQLLVWLGKGCLPGPETHQL